MPNMLIPQLPAIFFSPAVKYLHLVYAPYVDNAYIRKAIVTTNGFVGPSVQMQDIVDPTWVAGDVLILCNSAAHAVFGAWQVYQVVGNTIELVAPAMHGLNAGGLPGSEWAESTGEFWVVNLSRLPLNIDSIWPQASLGFSYTDPEVLIFSDVTFTAPEVGVVLGAIVSGVSGGAYIPTAWIDNGTQVKVVGVASYFVEESTVGSIGVDSTGFVVGDSDAYTSRGARFLNDVAVSDPKGGVVGVIANYGNVEIAPGECLIHRSPKFPLSISGDPDYSLTIKVNLATK